MSPYSPARPCNQAGCPALVRGASRCQAHTIRYQRPSRHSVGLDNDWARKSKAKIAQTPWCWFCFATTDLTTDHIVPREAGGSDDDSNLRVLCRTCNSKRAGGRRGVPASEQFLLRERDLKQRALSRVVHVCGAPATGKTWLLKQLDARLGLPTFSIDEERELLLRPGQSWPADSLAAWVALEDSADTYSPCVVETSGLHGNSKALLAGRQVYTVLCTASLQTRQRRLQDRVATGYRLAGNQIDYVDRLLFMHQPNVQADSVWTSDGAQSVEIIVKSVERWLLCLRG